MKTLVNGALVEAQENNRWLVKTEDISVTYAFDEEQGVCISSFCNTAGKEPVEYVEKPYSILPVVPKKEGGRWELVDAVAEETTYGGRAVAKLTLTVHLRSLTVRLHVVAFPGTSVLRQWFEIENESIARVERLEIRPFQFKLSVPEPKDIYYAEWFGGGKPVHEAGGLNRKAFTVTYYEPYSLHLESQMTAEYVPLIILTRDYGPKDGVMMAMDYVGPWSADLYRPDGYSADDYIQVSYTIDGGQKAQMDPETSLETPVITLAAYAEHRDNLMKTVFDWQYMYLWDYTNPDYFAKTRSTSRWAYSARCLTEQFNYRTAVMNLEENMCQEGGFEVVWDDAGWSALPFFPEDAYASVFQNNYEGPDHRVSQKYFRRAGLKWLLWFAGRPSIGVMENKEAAWGSFEWRTDDIVFRDRVQEKKFKDELKGYLEKNPNRSFHTCSLGGRYSHTFDMQRYSNYNYASDAGGGYNLNHYFSFFEVPDKWGDILASMGGAKIAHDGTLIWTSKPTPYTGVHYNEEFSRRRLGMVSLPMLLKEETRDINRFDNSIYRYLRENGVAGRWSYVYHPKVYGDDPVYYLQRVSHDHLRGCIIFGHRPEGQVTVFPRGLLEDALYEISFQNRSEVYSLTGAELMQKGLTLETVGCGELIYLNLSRHPGAAFTHDGLSAPVRAFVRSEMNIGHNGVGIYWTALPDKGVSHYAVYRNGELLANVAVGAYWFDYSAQADLDACYEVSAVSDSGEESSRCLAEKIVGEPFATAANGNHGAQMGDKSWFAEYSYDLNTFTPMTFVEPAASPLADLGGTPNQVGGIEGYWEGPGGARVGRGWQQTSAEVYCVRKYVADRARKVQIVARVNRDWYHMRSGGTIRAAIMLGDRTLMPWTELKKDSLYGADYIGTVELLPGDELRFILERSQNQQPLHYDEQAEVVSWQPVITTITDALEDVENLRINCGGKTEAVDEYGNRWVADTFRKQGNSVSFDNTDNALLKTGTAGQQITYEIPVKKGLYSVRLRFAELAGLHAGQRVMDVAINGALVQEGMDIAEIGLFTEGEAQRVYWNVLSGEDDTIRIQLTAQQGEALVQAIEVAPVGARTVRVNCGSEKPFVDWMGNVWQADTAGDSVHTDVAVKLASPTLYDQDLYKTGRCGQEITYRIPVIDGFYSVHLKFAELWLSEGGRPVDVLVNGKLVKKFWDARTAAGYKNMAADLRFDAISPVDGAITVCVRARGEHPAVLQALEVEAEA